MSSFLAAPRAGAAAARARETVAPVSAPAVSCGSPALSLASWQRAPEAQPLHPAHRVVTMAERVWIVREVDASLSPAAPRTQCLICESAFSIRSTWTYPREWARLPDGELLGLFH